MSAKLHFPNAEDPDFKSFLDAWVDRFNRPEFLELDPVQIPHGFRKKQDREIMGFWTAVLAWGNRKTIIAKARELSALLEGEPYAYVLNSSQKEWKRFFGFVHRTFNDTDTLYFLEFFRWYYGSNTSLESAFSDSLRSTDQTVEPALLGFRERFFSLPEHPERTRKHIPSPATGSTCKRLNMFLRWMVRKDDRGVDFGIWKEIRPSQLLLPLDVHVERVARQMGLIHRKQRNWQTVLELTGKMRELDPLDPVKYDFALFGLGALLEKPVTRQP